LAVCALAFRSRFSQPRDPKTLYNLYLANLKITRSGHFPTDTVGSALIANVYECLYGYEYPTKPYQTSSPKLAEGMPQVSKDGLTYTIRLKKGVKFYDPGKARLARRRPARR